MAKCPVCETRKAKRKCFLTAEKIVCSACCGSIRKAAPCSDCGYYQPPQAYRRYHQVPAYTTQQMEADDELQRYSFVIEGAIGAFDRQTKRTIRDAIPISIFEALLDKYYFKDDILNFANEQVHEGFTLVDNAINQDLQDLDREKLIKVLGVLHFIAKRRSRGRREYLAIVEQYVGERVAAGIRVIKDLS